MTGKSKTAAIVALAQEIYLKIEAKNGAGDYGAKDSNSEDEEDDDADDDDEDLEGDYDDDDDIREICGGFSQKETKSSQKR